MMSLRLDANFTSVVWSPSTVAIASYQHQQTGSSAGGKIDGEAVCFHNNTSTAICFHQLLAQFDEANAKKEEAHGYGYRMKIGSINMDMARENIACLEKDFEEA